MYWQSEKNFLSSNISSTCPDNMVNCGLLAAEIDPVVWGTPTNFYGFRVLAALLHGSQELGVSQTLRRWTEGATYIRQGGHHVGHWPTFLVVVYCIIHYNVKISIHERNDNLQSVVLYDECPGEIPFPERYFRLENIYFCLHMVCGSM